LRNVKNETSYFENGLKNRFRAIAFRADEHFPLHLPLKFCVMLRRVLPRFLPSEITEILFKLFFVKLLDSY
jgi:hypothetical protein